jgi:hypothetical protein
MRVRGTLIVVRQQQVLNAVCAVKLPYLSGMQIASFLSRIVLSSVACLPLPNFTTLFHKQKDFGENKY